MSEIASVQKTPFGFRDTLLFNERVIMTWKPASEVWPFRFGDEFLGCLTVFGNLFITHFFRKELKLRPFARMTCYFPVVFLPTAGSVLFNSVIITSVVIEKSSCPLCITTKAAIGQTTFGIVFPMLLASSVCLFVADRLLTYPVPPLVKAPKEVFLLLKKFILKSPRPFLVIGAMHMVGASIIAFQKQKCMKFIQERKAMN